MRFFAFLPLSVLIFALRAHGADEPQYARLRVESDPPGAEAVIVADLGKTPLVNEFIVPGMYRIELRHGGGYLPFAEELTLRGGQQAIVSQRLKKPQLFTKRRQIQLALGAGAVAGFAYAVQEQGTFMSYRERSALSNSSSNGNDEHAAKVIEYSEISNDAAMKRTIGLIAAGILTVALHVTIFIW
jgi:hypothetical protein